MSLVQVIVLAVVQGLTEFLPVSSSAHLVLVSQLFGWPDSGLAFDIALHIGTLLAVLVYFFKDWVQIVAQGLGIGYKNDAELSKNRTLLWLLAVASLPIGFFGFVFNKQAETSWRSPYVIGTMLIVVGLIMALAERISEKGRGIGDISFFDSIVIGFSQALAIVPGTSRSGITISAGLFRGLTRESAARFSFLLSTPAIAAAAAKSLHDLLKEGGLTPEVRTTFLLGILISAIVGGVVIKYFMKYLRHSTLNFFVYYRIVFGIIVIALASFFRHSAG